jgi:SAM-dependent methyltransferase
MSKVVLLVLFAYYRAMQYGVDIASIRLDDLDKRVLADVRERVDRSEMVSVLDVGCGQGGSALALAEAGAAVTGIDITDYSSAFQTEGITKFRFLKADVREWLRDTQTQFDIVVLQRVLHYLPYGEARTVLENLRLVTATLYLSVTGTTTAIANHYGALALPLSVRWGGLDTVGQELFSITAPLCLYREEELLGLLRDCGWEVRWSRVSDFGNVKVVAIRN